MNLNNKIVTVVVTAVIGAASAILEDISNPKK
jgi:hypothetical protein